MLNSPTGATFPGGSYLSLQVLAFWLSWVRALHTRGELGRNKNGWKGDDWRKTIAA